MSFQIGETVLLNSKEYKIVGTHKRSYLLERDGKRYTATANKMAKIIDRNNALVVAGCCAPSALARRVAFDKIFNKNAKAPETEAEILDYFERLRSDLSPENLSCDGEASHAHMQSSLREIRACWKELEAKLGRKVAE